MATVSTSFQDASQIESALSSLSEGITIGDALLWGVGSLSIVNSFPPSEYKYISSTQLVTRQSEVLPPLGGQWHPALLIVAAL